MWWEGCTGYLYGEKPVLVWNDAVVMDALLIAGRRGERGRGERGEGERGRGGEGRERWRRSYFLQSVYIEYKDFFRSLATKVDSHTEPFVLFPTCPHLPLSLSQALCFIISHKGRHTSDVSTMNPLCF